MPIFMLIVISVLFVIAVALGLKYVKQKEVDARDEIDKIAKKLGLNFDRGSLKHEPGLSGIYRGIPLAIQSVVTSSGTSLIYTTTYAITLTNKDISRELVAYPEGVVSKLGKLFGGEDIQLDDPELDDALIIKGTSCDAARAFFATPTVRQNFLHIIKEYKNFRFENRTLFFELPARLIDDAPNLQKQIEAFCDYAENFNSVSLPTELLDESTTLEVLQDD